MYNWLPEAIEQVKAVGRKHSINFEFEFGSPATHAQIRNVEQELGLTLPPSYKAFIQEFGEAHLFIQRIEPDSWGMDVYEEYVIINSLSTTPHQ